MSCAGLVPVMALAERAGLSELVAEKVAIMNAPIPSTGANPVGKMTSDIPSRAIARHHLVGMFPVVVLRNSRRQIPGICLTRQPHCCSRPIAYVPAVARATTSPWLRPRSSARCAS